MCLYSVAYSGSVKEDYELQERCGKHAEQLFEKFYGNGVNDDKNGLMMSRYNCHYNRKLNKCFMLLISTGSLKEKTKDNLGFYTDKGLWDINENKQFGQFFSGTKTKVVQCEVTGKTCHSESEWDSWIKPYMEE